MSGERRTLGRNLILYFKAKKAKVNLKHKVTEETEIFVNLKLPRDIASTKKGAGVTIAL